jgi:hypothetical protein
MNVRCPNCAHTWTTDRGVVNHEYAGSTADEIRLAREALAADEYEVPLPLMVNDPDTPDWLAALGVQGHLGDMVEWLGRSMGTLGEGDP